MIITTITIIIKTEQTQQQVDEDEAAQVAVVEMDVVEVQFQILFLLLHLRADLLLLLHNINKENSSTPSTQTHLVGVQTILKFCAFFSARFTLPAARAHQSAFSLRRAKFPPALSSAE